MCDSEYKHKSTNADTAGALRFRAHTTAIEQLGQSKRGAYSSVIAVAYDTHMIYNMHHTGRATRAGTR
jgi:hypothetical protein